MKLSVIISTRNELTMLSVTVMSCIEALVPLRGQGAEIIIVDNSDTQYKDLVRPMVPEGYYRDHAVRYYEQPYACLFTAREQAAREAKGEYIVCLDAHMLVGYNTLVDLVEFMDQRAPKQVGFAHAPITWAHQHESRARHDRDMRRGELGPWGVYRTVEQPISWKGMPWICRRKWFLEELGGYGALSEHKLSWGGGDMHIGIKPWLLGYENWAVPTRSCIHIGPYPHLAKQDRTMKDYGNRYRTYSESGKLPASTGFLVSCYVLGGEAMLERNAAAVQKRFKLDIAAYKPRAIELGKREREWLLARQVRSFDELVATPPWGNGPSAPLEIGPETFA